MRRDESFGLGAIHADDELLDRLGRRDDIESFDDAGGLEALLAQWTAQIDADAESVADRSGPWGLRGRGAGAPEVAPIVPRTVRIPMSRAAAIAGALVITMSGGGVAAALTGQDVPLLPKLIASARPAAAEPAPTNGQSVDDALLAAVGSKLLAGEPQEARRMVSALQEIAGANPDPALEAKMDLLVQQVEQAEILAAGSPVSTASPTDLPSMLASGPTTSLGLGLPSSPVSVLATVTSGPLAPPTTPSEQPPVAVPSGPSTGPEEPREGAPTTPATGSSSPATNPGGPSAPASSGTSTSDPSGPSTGSGSPSTGSGGSGGSAGSTSSPTHGTSPRPSPPATSSGVRPTVPTVPAVPTVPTAPAVPTPSEPGTVAPPSASVPPSETTDPGSTPSPTPSSRPPSSSAPSSSAPSSSAPGGSASVTPTSGPSSTTGPGSTQAAKTTVSKTTRAKALTRGGTSSQRVRATAPRPVKTVPTRAVVKNSGTTTGATTDLADR